MSAAKPTKKQILKAKSDFENQRKKAVETLLWETVASTAGTGTDADGGAGAKPSRSSGAERRPRDLLNDFPPFKKYSPPAKEGEKQEDIEIFFTALDTPSWTAEVETACFNITKTNMKDIYDTASGAGKWKWNDTKKRSELFVPEMRFIIARLKGETEDKPGEIVGFLAFKPEMFDSLDVFYVYEVHTTERVRRKGLGQRLMQIGELIARKNGLHR
jgi:ribosomal protein S18 acetylase RimI-like enzyme